MVFITVVQRQDSKQR